LVRSSLSEVWQFKFACCPQVLVISSVVHQLSCFGVGFSLSLFTGGLFLCLTPFLWGKIRDPSCCDGLLFVFQFCRAVWLWVLLIGSEDEHCGSLPAQLQAATYHSPTVGFPDFPVICLLIACVEISCLPLPPLQSDFSVSTPSALC
jgi:hypothetical protein